MPAYLIADVAAHDMDAYRASGYLETVREMAGRYGGNYLVRGGAMKFLEGNWEPSRLVVIEFPSMERLHAFYDSEEYAPWKETRGRLTDSKLIAVEGLDA